MTKEILSDLELEIRKTWLAAQSSCISFEYFMRIFFTKLIVCKVPKNNGNSRFRTFLSILQNKRECSVASHSDHVSAVCICVYSDDVCIFLNATTVVYE